MAPTKCWTPIVCSRLHLRPISRVPASFQGLLPRRHLQQDAYPPRKAPHFAFAFDIDGVLLRSAKPIPGARDALAYLQRHQIPFILLTNGGGKLEATRVADLSAALNLPLDERAFIQSHTPFADLVHGEGPQGPLQDKTILVLGGEGDRCRRVAESYGFRSVVSPGDIYHADPTVWPFSAPFASYYAQHARPLPLPIYLGPAATAAPLESHLQIHACFVYNDPRDWGLDTALLVDLLLSHRGFLGTRSGLNGRSDLPNHGYQSDGQPPLWFSNPDLWWASAHPLNRLGQGAFHASLKGVWDAVTDGTAQLQATMCGKPHEPTYAYAERRLVSERARMYGGGGAAARGGIAAAGPLSRVYMIGDNPASDIAGANAFRSPLGSSWRSVLVRSGVYTGGEPAEPPQVIVENALEAVRWALAEEGWDSGKEGEDVEEGHSGL